MAPGDAAGATNSDGGGGGGDEEEQQDVRISSSQPPFSEEEEEPPLPDIFYDKLRNPNLVLEEDASLKLMMGLIDVGIHRSRHVCDVTDM